MNSFYSSIIYCHKVECLLRCTSAICNICFTCKTQYMLACHYYRYENKKTHIFETIYLPCALDVTLLDYKGRLSL